MRIRILFSVIALVAVTGGVVHASGVNVANEIGYAVSAFTSDDIAQSGISRTSFGNVPSVYDALRQPWQYPHVDANRSRRLGFTPRGNGIQNQLVWTQLGNTTGEDTFGFAYLGNRGEKGLLGAQISYTSDDHDFTSIDTLPSFVNTDLQNETYRSFSGYVGYGWAPSDTVSHGVGLSIQLGEDNYRDTFFTSGSGGSRFEDRAEADELRLTYGVRFTPSDEFSWTLEGVFGTGSIESFGRSASLDAMGVVSSATTFGNIDLDNDTLGVAGQYNWYPSDTWDYQIRWSYSMSDYSLNNTLIDYNNTGGTISAFQNATDDDVEGSDLGISGGVAYHDGPLHIYGGASVWLQDFEVDVLGDFDSPTSFQFRQAAEQEITVFTPSVAFLYEFNDHVALIGGAEYNWFSEEFEDDYLNIDVMTPANNSRFYDELEWTTNDSAIRAGVELRFKKLLVDIGVSHSEHDGVESIDADEIFFSARFGL